jgi:radical SAM superfamily enzyme YgiQ (UPF0313 family)
MNYLLVLPRIVQNIGEGYVFPIGLLYVSASLKAAGYSVYTLNLNHIIGDVDAILHDYILNNKINVLCTGGLSPQYHLIKSIIKYAKALDSKIITVVGGGIISADPDVAMTALEFADYGIIGEGEITICELASSLENKSDKLEVNGLIIKKDDKLIKTSPRAEIRDLDSLPWADYEGFNIDAYLDLPAPSSSGLNSNRLINMMIGRSCPYKCSFCFHTVGQKYRKRSLDNFFKEFEYLHKKYRIEHVSIIDELFLPKADDVKEFCLRIKRYNVTWDADFSVKNIKRELLPIMKESGLNLMQFGLESADNRILASMNKGVTIEEIESVLKMVNEYNIPFFGAFIFGDVAETAETAANTMKWWREHPEFLIHLTLIKPFPGSPIYKYACRKGIISDPVKYLKDGCPQINISKMSNDEFALLAKEISDASDSLLQVQNVDLLTIDSKQGIATMTGDCPACSSTNTWADVKLFSITYLSCCNCAQKFHIPLPKILYENIEKNIFLLLKKHSKVAIWGMTLPVMDLVKNLVALPKNNVFPIDISASKQGMDLYGYKVHDPKVLDKERIPVVIIGVPFYITQISQQIKENYSFVIKIIDICCLTDHEFSSSYL